MQHAQMSAQRLPEKPAFEAGDIVVLPRSPDRDRRLQRDCGRHRHALAKAAERAMHHRNQSRNLINGDIILRHIIRTICATRLRSTCGMFHRHDLVPQSCSLTILLTLDICSFSPSFRNQPRPVISRLRSARALRYLLYLHPRSPLPSQRRVYEGYPVLADPPWGLVLKRLCIRFV